MALKPNGQDPRPGMGGSAPGLLQCQFLPDAPCEEKEAQKDGRTSYANLQPYFSFTSQSRDDGGRVRCLGGRPARRYRSAFCPGQVRRWFTPAVLRLRGICHYAACRHENRPASFCALEPCGCGDVVRGYIFSSYNFSLAGVSTALCFIAASLLALVGSALLALRGTPARGGAPHSRTACRKKTGSFWSRLG